MVHEWMRARRGDPVTLHEDLRGRRRSETWEPAQRRVAPGRDVVVLYAAAVVVPTVCALVLVPWREDHARAMAVVMVVPVVVVATLGSVGPAVVAAMAAGIAYDVLLTRPYLRLAVDDSDDLTATIILLVVGLVVGVLSSRADRLATRAHVRHGEVGHLVEVAALAAVDPPATRAELVASAERHLVDLLGLVRCEWQEGACDPSTPVLLPSGEVIGPLPAMNQDRAKLPRLVGLPAVAGERRAGCFVLTSDGRHVASLEERLSAVTVATIFALACQRSDAGHPRSAAARPDVS